MEKEKRSALARAAFLLLIGRTCLFLFPYRWVHGTIQRLSQPGVSNPNTSEAKLRLVVWAVENSGRYLAGSNACLPKAMAGVYMLNKADIPAQYLIGVRKEASGILMAHAWVEVEKEVVIGGPATFTGQYTPLTKLNGVNL